MTAPRFVAPSAVLAQGRPAGLAVCRDGARVVTWSEFAPRIGGVARALGARPERRWLIDCPDPLDFLAALLGVLLAGRHAVVAPGFQPGMKAQLRAEYDGVLGEEARAFPAAGTAGAALAAGAARIDLFTSGSSGEPKRVSKTLAQLETEAAVLEETFGATLGDATVAATVPHHHIYGILFRLIWPLGAGRAFDAALCADPQQLVARMRELRDVALVSSPAHLGRLPELVDLAVLRPAVRRIFSSGGPLAAQAAVEFQRQYGAAPTEIYGSTESGGIGWREQDGSEERAAWTPFPRLALRIDDEGALCLRSPYLADDDWLTMGDAAELLPGGRFRLKGRLDRVVKIEGKRASLPELEHALRQHPLVRDAAVVPLSGSRQALGAVVVLHEAAQLAEGREALVGTLRAFLLERFERVLVPRQWRFPERLPFDERGKLAASALAALFRPDDAPAA